MAKTLRGNINHIEQKGEDYTNNYGTYHNWQVILKSGEVLYFLTRQGYPFKHGVGDEIYYQLKNEETGNAKLVEAPEEQQSFQKPEYIKPIAPKPFGQSKAPDTQTSIIRQSSLKAAIEFHATDKISRVEEVLNTARIFVEFVNNG
jgi:hypothetical protein